MPQDSCTVSLLSAVVDSTSSRLNLSGGLRPLETNSQVNFHEEERQVGCWSKIFCFGAEQGRRSWTVSLPSAVADLS